MLLEFQFQNYKSFYGEASFSMNAEADQHGLDYSLFDTTGDNKVLCCSAIYGSNAAGKTSIIGAMETFRAIVRRGNIRNAEAISTANYAASRLCLIPNQRASQPKPVKFYVDFIVDKTRFQYELVIDLGLFLDNEYERRVLSETLIFNGKTVFDRKCEGHKTTLTVSPHPDLITMFSNVAIANMANAASLALDSLECDELFLTDGFKLIFSPTIAKKIMSWFETQFLILRWDEVSSSDMGDAVLNTALKLFGANANPIVNIQNEESNIKLLSSILSRDNQQISIPADVYESEGTIRFIKMFPSIIRVIQSGGTLVIDDFDTSIHSVVLMNIINLFHNDEFNTNHAQLIFTSHNPIFLNSNLLRRDEIKFVERDSDDHTSSLYALSDFGSGIGKDEDYLKRYLANMYGAIPNIDFTSLFESNNTSGE